MLRIALALMAATLLAFGDMARAENECGPPEPGVELVCSPSTYDPAGGNIFYGPDESNGDFTIRLTDDLALDYDREHPGDDAYIDPNNPESLPLYSAIWITPTETGYGYKGDISVVSSADVTSNGRGISVGHYGESGELRVDLRGGNFTTMGESAYAVHSRHEGAGASRLIARNLTINTNGTSAHAILSSHAGVGDTNIDVRGSAISTMGTNARGIVGAHFGAGDVTIDAQALTVSTMGESAHGILGQHTGEGSLDLHVQGGAISTTGETARGIWGLHFDAGAVTIDAQALTVSTMGESAHGIFGRHTGEGILDLDVQGGAISTMGKAARGIWGEHFDTGDVTIDAQALTVSTMGETADGIFGQHRGEGSFDLDVQGGAISTTGDNALGIAGLHFDAGALTIDAQDLTVSTTGENADGIFGQHRGEGSFDLHVQGGAITTTGDNAWGIYGRHFGAGALTIDAQGLTVTTTGDNARGIFGAHWGAGALTIDAQGLTISTTGTTAYGIFGQHAGEGSLDLHVQGGAISTTGTTASGIAGAHYDAGDIVIDVRGVTITTESTGLDPDFGDTAAYGVYAGHFNPTDADGNPLTDSDGNVIQGTGNIAIGLTGSEISTRGEGSHGVYAEHESGIGEIRITVDGGTIGAGGMEASGIQIGRLDAEGMIENAAALGEDGYRTQSVSVNGRVSGGSGEGAGVYLAGGGEVAIGPKGSVGAASGMAIRAAGGAPRLHVALDLAGRRVGTVLQEGVIRNDGGETTLRVNGVPLHDGVAGATGRTVLNGAWDLTLPAGDTIAGRDFSTRDFAETYAPRAAVYEALPGLLLRLHGRGPAGELLTVPGSPAWVRVAGGVGRYTPEQASVGATYDYRRGEVEAGLDVELGPGLTGTLSVLHVQGSGDVSSPTGGGEISARGLGGALGVGWSGPGGYYFRGRVSVLDYDVDLTSDGRGRLTEDAGAVGHSLGVETGRRFKLSEGLRLTPRVWVRRSKIDLGFTDAVQSRLRAEDSDRLTAGTGVVAETERVWANGTRAFTVRGSLDVWRTLGEGTAVKVSQGEPLKSVSDKTRVLLSLGGEYRWGRFSVSGVLAAGGPGSRDREYAGYLNLGIQF